MGADFLKKNQKDLRRHVCSMRQIARVRESVLNDGRGRGIRIVDFKNGAGLDFTVLLDRGMDIEEASFKGIPLGWLSAGGCSHPGLYHDAGDGFGWLRTWHGGLVTGCGLYNAGAPSGTDLTLHGRLSHLQAEKCVRGESWIDGKYVLSVSGELRESRMFGENLLLKRTVSTVMGTAEIEITDTVTNEGFGTSPVMMLYHINLGFPMISPSAEIVAKKHPVVPRDNVAAPGLATWNKLIPPQKGFKEQCFYHDIPAEKDGYAKIAVSNPDLGLGFEVSYRKKELPFLTEWKMMGEGEYVLGIEPANCHVEGMDKEREHFKSLKRLEPGESVEFSVKMKVVEKRN